MLSLQTKGAAVWCRGGWRGVGREGDTVENLNGDGTGVHAGVGVSGE